MSQTINISVPEGMNFSSEDTKIDDPAFKFAYKRTHGDNKVTLHYFYETLEDHVDAAHAPDYLKNVSNLLDNLDYEISADKDTAENPASPAPESKASLTAASPQYVSPTQRWLILSPFLLVGVIWFFRALKSQHRKAVAGPEPEDSLHRCAFCGKTEISAPDTEFRISVDGEEYCRAHLPKTT